MTREARNKTAGQGGREGGRERERETKGDREMGWVRVGWAGSEEESIHNDTKTDKTHKKRGERHLHLSEHM